MSDYISREELLKHAVPHKIGTYGYSANVNDWAVTVGDIKETPAADVEPVRHAHWIDQEPELIDDEHQYRCSACCVEDTIHPALLHNAKYCHFCGAKMDGEQE